MSRQALEGLKVVEFAAYAAGPVTGKHLADFGATVVHIESGGRPDGFRVQYPPFAENKPGVNRSGCFGVCNNNKYGITINLKAEGGIDLAKEVVAWADVVIENFTPGTMERLGLGYEELCKVNEKLIMFSSCNQGQGGRHATHPGFGSQLTSLTGFTNLTGFPDGPLSLLFGPYIDFIGVGYGVISIMAALDYRRRTGFGQYIDLAQYENGLQFLAPIILENNINGRVWERMGNRHEYAAPHGVFPCKGQDRWCALSVFTDAEWQKLREVMDEPAWAAESKFSTMLDRKNNEDELESKIEAWTVGFTPEELMEKLQAVGVRAGVVNRIRDAYSDPQYAHRQIWQGIEHSEMGLFHYQAPPFELSETPAVLDRPSPCLGEHNEQFFCDILGMSKERYQEAITNGIIA
ncbi:CaiB/BaiF CoA-transferase family protein [Desulfosporosinus sp. BICA1-9]|uniref:CaiB/BaiF CoA transferase family protein n=1 Tax=Desulfosporosinus sp. BICA1-9 TaxID=1531958 RepID=UPI00054BB248|nr:CoA transferase [Desulfosporosinus sp. BICA1-9]KJS48823.1 MAG: hypothetical protein VR66_11840 [Peptococcaceae bacterium BRH_c23]KJS87087.1 MAG: hypothetical protein JL57_15050 [Desulfosporosinus sp. BICA1-9]HBW34165.1 CoA transferase [Desulfosporosinus sp.]